MEFCRPQECCIAMPLSQIIFFEEQAAGIGKRSVLGYKYCGFEQQK